MRCVLSSESETTQQSRDYEIDCDTVEYRISDYRANLCHIHLCTSELLRE
jgi:hypothetical protein